MLVDWLVPVLVGVDLHQSGDLLAGVHFLQLLLLSLQLNRLRNARAKHVSDFRRHARFFWIALAWTDAGLSRRYGGFELGLCFADLANRAVRVGKAPWLRFVD